MDPNYVSQIWDKLQDKVDRMASQLGDRCPHAAGADGKYDDMPAAWWTSGFWPGILWLMHDMNGKPQLRELAWQWDEKIEYVMNTTLELYHDVGFQFLNTAGMKYWITGDGEARRRGLAAANYLAGRFNPVGNYIRAWNEDLAGWAIVDCSMNLSLLFWASEETKDPRFKHIAIKHADTVLQHFIRPDGSCSHIVSFNPETGERIESIGGQGYGPDSAWSRGQSWALYGMANTYRYTKDIRYLDAAKRVAHYFIASLPDDGIPHWDFRVPNPEDEPRDTSAAAIAASGLLEMAELVPEVESSFYYRSACHIIHSLTEKYGTWDQPEHEGILLGGTSHKPANSNVNVSLIYGDYFYVEALAKLMGWKRKVY
ncbi:glycoside hydrolase family 88 protein [Paenibacillus caseinilyticus]|uniref:Glycosyl hydrolase n=1 Tax=Paenibacillus mucilaginosus K02 TaxID=997761 RepID=I0BEJ9_9BACL|nr:glycoside hydrolase family 88 protein [Paenibacillus mucilaginosus]AFH60796.1 glycosyl hydrolase [Paenibacillus mucilaginosus K02]